VFVALCLQLVVAITNYERRDDPDREKLKLWDQALWHLAGERRDQMPLRSLSKKRKYCRKISPIRPITVSKAVKSVQNHFFRQALRGDREPLPGEHLQARNL